MNKDRLKRIILDNQEIIKKRKIIFRNLSIDFKDLEKLNKIIAIIGPRRAGKTFYLKQIIEEINLSDKEIVFLDFSEIVLSGFNVNDFEMLETAYFELYPENNPYFFFDEIQEINDFEKGLKYLLNKGYRIIITGSSAAMMQKDISTILRGKSLYYTLYPLSFLEFLKFKQFSQKEPLTTRRLAKLKKYLSEFLLWGGFPEVVLSEKEETKKNLITSYIDIMLFRDIIEQHSVKNIHLIKLLFIKLIKSFTKEVSVNKWYNDFKSQGYKISKDTIHLYLNYFKESMFVFFISNLNGGITSNKKVYLIDNGLYNRVKGIQFDKGKLLENQVFRDLIINDTKINFYKNKSTETNFLINDTAIQVCRRLTVENSIREIKGLEVCNNLESITNLLILTGDVEYNFEHKVIQAIPYWKAALENLF